MNLCIDQGNSSTKVGVFDDNVLIDYFAIEELSEVEIEKLFERFSIDACIISSVTMKYDELLDILNKKNIFLVQLDHHTAVPIVNKYETPHTLGKDRLAAIVGAVYLEPETDLLIVDAGTAITYDLVVANGVYWGGNIAPGLSMRLRSLHEFTQKLPLVAPVVDSPLIGNSTNSALISGALHGIVFEIDGYINALKIKYPKLSVFLTGGSIFYFDTKLKSPIFAERNLVLIGLNRILQYNVQK